MSISVDAERTERTAKKSSGDWIWDMGFSLGARGGNENEMRRV